MDNVTELVAEKNENILNPEFNDGDGNMWKYS